MFLLLIEIKRCWQRNSISVHRGSYGVEWKKRWVKMRYTCTLYLYK